MPVSAVASATERILDMMRYGHRSRTGRKTLLPLRDIGDLVGGAYHNGSRAGLWMGAENYRRQLLRLTPHPARNRLEVRADKVVQL